MDNIDSLAALISAEYGIEVAVREIPTVTVNAVTPVKLVSNNPRRVALYVANATTDNIYIHIDRNVSATSGILVKLAGGTIVIDWRSDLILPAWEWFAISAVAAVQPLVLEVVIL